MKVPTSKVEMKSVSIQFNSTTKDGTKFVYVVDKELFDYYYYLLFIYISLLIIYLHIIINCLFTHYY